MNNKNKSKRYYWIKLKDSFLTSDKVDFLMSQKDGANYVVLYQMLCLMTINTNGVLGRNIGEILIPFNEEKIQRDCKFFTIDTVRMALYLYKQLGMIFQEGENGLLKITDFDEMVGSVTYGAIEKREQRAAEKLEEKPAIQIDNGIDKGIDNVYQEIKILDNRDKDIRDIENRDNNNIVASGEAEENIFRLWNSENIIIHRELNDVRLKAIRKALKTYSAEEICEAIKHYSLILKSNWYFKHKWSLEDFLTRKNGLPTFTTEGSNWASFQEDMNKDPRLHNLLPIEPNEATRETPSFVKGFIDSIR